MFYHDIYEGTRGLYWGPKQQEIIDALANRKNGEKVTWKGIVAKASLKSIVFAYNDRSERDFEEEFKHEMGTDWHEGAGGMRSKHRVLTFDNEAVWFDLATPAILDN
jgi:hypothetical protein